MTSEKRREYIERILKEKNEPVTATVLSKEFSVSRQVIVGDIALMRAAGIKIFATPRGYILDSENEDKISFTIACRHDNENMAKELYIIVDNGGIIHDVTVEHPVYGEIKGELRIASRYDVRAFLEKLNKNEAQPLMHLTGGIHIHNIKCRTDDERKRILESLRREGIILE